MAWFPSLGGGTLGGGCVVSILQVLHAKANSLRTAPGMPAILVQVDEFGQELHLPIEVARQVSEAITRAIAPVAAWCKPAGCTA